MGTMPVVIDLEISKLSLQVAGVPEERVIEKLTTNGSDQSLDKGMGSWNVGDTFDFLDIQDA